VAACCCTDSTQSSCERVWLGVAARLALAEVTTVVAHAKFASHLVGSLCVVAAVQQLQCSSSAAAMSSVIAV
jgi:hypothetical protein